MNVEKKNTTCDWCALKRLFFFPRHMCNPLSGSVSAAFAHLGLEPGLDGIHRPPRATGLAGHEKDSVLLGQEGVWRLARLACDVLH
jgi:hypothetical protein